jgi:hypothetical protein
VESRGNTRPDDRSDRYLMSDCPMGGVWRWRRGQEDVGEGSNNEDGGWAREGEFKVTGTGGLNGPRTRSSPKAERARPQPTEYSPRRIWGRYAHSGVSVMYMAGDADL